MTRDRTIRVENAKKAKPAKNSLAAPADTARGSKTNDAGSKSEETGKARRAVHVEEGASILSDRR